MALPAFAKSWQFDVNQQIPYQGSVADTEKLLLFTIKNSFKGFAANAWTCSGSSDSVTAAMDGTDRWVTVANLVKGFGVHSWIVLRQVGIASTFEVCFDLNTIAGNSMTVVVSPSAGFTGGATNARPTATDEIILLNSAGWCANTSITSFRLHIWQSSDGQCTRVQVWRTGSHMCTFWLFDKPQGADAGWTDSSVSICLTALSSGYAATYALLQGASNFKGRYDSVTRSLAAAGQFSASLYGGGLLQEGQGSGNSVGMGQGQDAVDGKWALDAVGLGSVDGEFRGIHGNLYDLWWRPVGLNDGDSFPYDNTKRKYVAFGPLIYPWLNDGTVPKLA